MFMSLMLVLILIAGSVIYELLVISTDRLIERMRMGDDQ